MSRKLIPLTLAALLASTAAASAQPTEHRVQQQHRAVVQQHKAVTQEHRAVNQEHRAVNEERRAVNQDRRAVNQDRRVVNNQRQAVVQQRQAVNAQNRFDRNNRNWWRGRSDFKAYTGARTGYWFTPGVGYHRVDPRYYGYRWGTGQVVPLSLRSYAVAEPGFYGVRAATPGLRWIYLGPNLALVDLRTGRIVDFLPNAF